MSEEQKLSFLNKHGDEPNLGHVNLAQETEDNNSDLEHAGKELSALKQEEIDGEISENDEKQTSEEWWKFVQALVQNDENDNGNIPARYSDIWSPSLCYSDNLSSSQRINFTVFISIFPKLLPLRLAS